jgi:hypothetical protein
MLTRIMAHVPYLPGNGHHNPNRRDPDLGDRAQSNLGVMEPRAKKSPWGILWPFAGEGIFPS